MEPIRQEEHQRNQRLEALLQEISALLAPVEADIVARFTKPRSPVVFIVGVPRAGSTLMMQWLASTGYFAYPTNLLSRFYAAPCVGAKIQQLLADPRYNFNDEIMDFSGSISFASHLGKTKGALAPNEFWYFWRRFIPNTIPRLLTHEEETQIDAAGFLAELAAVESVFDKPLMLKALILQLNIPYLAGLFEKSLFIFVKRRPFFNIQSLLQSRENYFGSREGWYSIKPPQYPKLSRLDPIHQVAGQVYYTQQAVEQGIGQLNPARALTVDYEAFCNAPQSFFDRITAKLSVQEYNQEWIYRGLPRFEHTNRVRLPVADVMAIKNAWYYFSGEMLETS